MEGFLNRYRNITVLFLVIFAQLLLLAYQVKNDSDVRLIRVWTVTAVTPVARVLEGLRGGSLGFVRNYITLHNAETENRALREENGRLKLKNTFLENELNRADRAKALQMFQAHTPSQMVAATVIATGAGSNSKVVYVDRGSAAGVMRGMGVLTPDGIVGKVIAAYPTASEVLLITDPDFAAGVISQKHQVHGTLKGEGTPLCRVDYVPSEENVEVGEWFYTSGDDRVFPRGFQVGVVKAVKPGQPFKEVYVQPSGIQRGVEDVLILIHGAHQDIPETPAANQPVYIAPAIAPPAEGSAQPPAGGAPATQTEADKLRAIYKSVGEAQKHTFGESGVGAKPPDFKKLPNEVPAPGAAGAPPAGAPGAGPAATKAAPNAPPANPPGAAAGTGATKPAPKGAPEKATPAPAATAGPRGGTGTTGPRAPAAGAPARMPATAPGGPAR